MSSQKPQKASEPPHVVLLKLLLLVQLRDLVDQRLPEAHGRLRPPRLRRQIGFDEVCHIVQEGVDEVQLQAT